MGALRTPLIDLQPLNSLLKLIGAVSVPVAHVAVVGVRRAPSFFALMFGIGLLLLLAAYPNLRDAVTLLTLSGLGAIVALAVACYGARRRRAPEVARGYGTRARWAIVANVLLPLAFVIDMLAFGTVAGIVLVVIAAALGAEWSRRPSATADATAG